MHSTPLWKERHPRARVALLGTVLAVLAVPSAAHGAAWGINTTESTQAESHASVDC
jgi:hypothetical protein